MPRAAQSRTTHGMVSLVCLPGVRCASASDTKWIRQCCFHRSTSLCRERKEKKQRLCIHSRMARLPHATGPFQHLKTAATGDLHLSIDVLFLLCLCVLIRSFSSFRPFLSLQQPLAARFPNRHPKLNVFARVLAYGSRSFALNSVAAALLAH